MTTHHSAANLLIQCLSAGRQPPAVSPQASADWNAVVDLARDHGLAPFAYRRLKESGTRAHVPADAWKKLRKVYFDSAGANARLYRELGPALARLRGSGVSVMVLKGAYLAPAVYGDIALRPMGDVDLLVREADLERARKALLDLGGVYQRFEDVVSNRKRKRHLPQIRIGHLAVELHWNIASPSGPVNVDIAGLWNRACPYNISGVEVLVPSLEDLLLHQCLHACYQNHLAELLNLCDVAETTRRFGSRIDWEQLARRASAWGVSRYVALALHTAREMLGADVPDRALELLVPGGLDRRVIAAARQLALARTGYGRWMPFFHAVRVPALTDKARLSWQRVFLSREEMAVTYPESRGARPLIWYYARRVGHVLSSYAAHTLRRAHLMASSPERDNAAALVKWLEGRD